MKGTSSHRKLLSQNQQRLFEKDKLQQLFQAYEKIAQQQLRAYENAQPLEPTALYEWAKYDRPQKPSKKNNWPPRPRPG